MEDDSSPFNTFGKGFKRIFGDVYKRQEQYDEGRVTVLTDNELVVKITECCQELGIIL